MKRKLLVATLAVLTILLCTMSAGALTPGAVYVSDEGGRMVAEVSKEKGMALGKSYYVALEPAPASTQKPGGGIGNKLTIIAKGSSSREIQLLQSTDLVRRKTGPNADDWWWFLELSWKSLTTTGAYSADGYEIKGEIKAGSHVISLDGWGVAYPEGEKRLRAEPQFFGYSDEEAGVFLPDGRSFLIIDSKDMDSRLVLAMNTAYNDSFAKQYPEAKLSFYMGNGAMFAKEAVVAITGKPGERLYEYNNGQLYDLTNYFNSRASAFTFKTKSLGFYVRSDRALGQPTEAVNTPPSTAGTGSETKATASDQLSDMVQRYFSNNFALASYGSKYEILSSSTPIRYKADLSSLNTQSLCIYAYDEANNNLVEMTNHEARVEGEYLYFNTSAKGRFVITDAPLAAR